MVTIVLGGAFDPPHLEHVNMIRSAFKQLRADRLVIVPTYSPPHKSEGFLSFQERVQLIKIAFKNIDIPFIVDEIENERKSDNYSYKVLPILKEKYGDIIFLIGGDSISHFDTWKNTIKIVECCPIAVAQRDGYNGIKTKIMQLKEKFGGEFILLDFVGKDISSSIIKTKLLLGLDIDCIDDNVMTYIESNGLFLDYEEYLKKLESYQSPELFEHSKNVVLKAVSLNSHHNLKQDFKKVFLSALLHDNAKDRLSLDGFDIPIDSIDSPVLHQFLGAFKANRDFNIKDEDILNAICYHTTAKADMSVLEKLIYVADSVSDDRNYAPIHQLREIVEESFEEGFKAILKYTYEKVVLKGKKVYHLTEDAKNFYLE